MTQQKIAALLNAWNGKILNEYVLAIAENLKKVSPTFLVIPLKEMIVGLLLGFFGIDRFCRDDTELSIAKLVLTVTYVGLLILFEFLLIYFLYGREIKEDNYQKIRLTLGGCNTEV